MYHLGDKISLLETIIIQGIIIITLSKYVYLLLITKKQRSSNYCHSIFSLFRNVLHAPGILCKLLYLYKFSPGTNFRVFRAEK